jgi:hypothetical protein
MRSTWLALPLAARTLGLAACGGDENDSKAGNKYPSDVEDNFMKACKTSSGGKEDACKCALKKLEETVSYDDFKKADEAIREGGKASGDTAERIQDAITSCA